MAKKIIDPDSVGYKAWYFDQLTKSAFFHQKLHEWRLVETAEQIEQIKGEDLVWDNDKLKITDNAWHKAIHRGIRPVIIFAHPDVLQKVPGAMGYYRMLAMVSQKSMNNLGRSVMSFERGSKMPDSETSAFFAAHLNRIISQLIENDEKIDAREFELWRGMAAGSQAQGSWQNAKGSQAEVLLRGMIEKRLQEKRLARELGAATILLNDSREIAFSSEPDIAIYQNGRLQIAIEVKGGIDTAAVLERVGAAIKSLKRAKEENLLSLTILIMQEVSFTERARKDLELNKGVIDHFFMLENLIEHTEEKETFLKLLDI